MEPQDIIAEIDKLELSEKLILIEDVWDSIAKSNSKLPMPEWQKNELDKRAADLKNSSLPLSDWNSVHAKLRSEINEG